MKQVNGDGSQAARGFFAFGVLLAYLVFSPLLAQLGVPTSDAAISLMDWQRIYELITVGVIVLSISCWLLTIKSNFFILKKTELFGWVLFFLGGACSSFIAELPNVAWLEWSWTLCWFLSTFLLALCFSTKTDVLQGVVQTFVIVVVASYATLFYVFNADPLFDPAPIIIYGFPGFNNLRVFADYQTVVLFFIPFAIQRLDGYFLWRWCAWSLAGSYVALAFASGSRGLFLGQLVAILAVVYFSKDRWKYFLFGQLRMWCSGILAFGVLFVFIPWLINDLPVTNSLIRGGLSSREVLWQQAISMAIDNPFFGEGPMHFAVFANKIAASPHNQVLQLMAEWGLPAALIFVALVGKFLYEKLCSIRSNVGEFSNEDSLFVQATMAAFVALVVQSFVSPVFNNPTSQILLSMLLVLIIKVIPRSESVEAAYVKINAQVLAIVSISSTVFFAWCVTPWILNIEERTSCYIEHKDDRPTWHFAPRFWQQGWIFLPCEPTGSVFR